MAETHAIAFFIAKGMLDAGVGLHVTYAPPSFQAIARTVEVVRGDAGHLFAAIQRENPYAKEARGRLLEALSAVDSTLVSFTESSQAAGSLPPPALSIPERAAPSPELREARELIDDVDAEMIRLLAQRAALSRRAASAKASLGKGVFDGGREASLLADRRTWAHDAGLDKESVEDVFRAILRLSRRVQGMGP